MPLFVGETRFDALIDQAARDFDVPRGLIKATIATESAFKPDAYRAEPQIGDASRGLMQVLLGTARDELGYRGDPEGLFDPAVIIPLGARYLRMQFERTGSKDWADAASAYNGGYRPRIGFGARRDDGTYRNQEYVDRVLRYWAHYKANDPPPARPVPDSGPTDTPVAAAGCLPVLLVAAGLLSARLVL